MKRSIAFAVLFCLLAPLTCGAATCVKVDVETGKAFAYVTWPAVPGEGVTYKVFKAPAVKQEDGTLAPGAWAAVGEPVTMLDAMVELLPGWRFIGIQTCQIDEGGCDMYSAIWFGNPVNVRAGPDTITGYKVEDAGSM